MHDLRGFPVVFINGPPRAGKDTAANALAAQIGGAHVMRFAESVKRGTNALFGLPPDTPTDAFEHCKEAPTPVFLGMTPRQAYIMFSQKMVKPATTADFFGRVFTQRLRDLAFRHPHGMVVVPDSGFVAEMEPVVYATGRDAAMLIRVHADARGCSFASDSRSFVTANGVHTVDLTNDGADKAPFTARVVAEVRRWLRDRPALARAS